MMNKQGGHFDLSFLYWLAGAVGIVLTTGGLWLVVFAIRGLA